MKKVDIILFTYNRACQADLALRSIRDLFKNVGVVWVFYKHSTPEYKLGYDKLFSTDYGLEIKRSYQTNFNADFKTALNQLKADYYTGFCDDDVFIKETNCDDILVKLDEPDVSSISLKIHANQTWHYPGYESPLPNFIETHPYLKWNWRQYHRYDVDFGYPSNVNAMIYKREYFTNLIMPNAFNCPNSMEGSLNEVRPKFKDCICSFRETRVLNIAVNMVQNFCTTNPHELHYTYKIEDLNRKFLDGEVISTDNIYGKQVMMTSDEVEYRFKKA